MVEMDAIELEMPEADMPDRTMPDATMPEPLESQSLQPRPLEQVSVERQPLQVELPPPDGLLSQTSDAPDVSEPPPATANRQPESMPEIADKPSTRPKRSSPHSVAQAIMTPVLETTAGLSETAVEFTFNPPPKYPIDAMARRIEGIVTLKLYINVQGKVAQVEVQKTSGHASLDQAAAAAVSRWSGKPATRFGRPVPSEEVLPVRFRL
ncbi:Gram-negative bacterial tonB protein [Stieleria varia]|uniref:Gram-negative bacterial tonB protein n=2 Tax=Stieleria varia TaxID=2528005 RepID=A0A5C6B928_9BACT|nr:Gram-negative bacterial tonB protein [Stieleria varia]